MEVTTDVVSCILGNITELGSIVGEGTWRDNGRVGRGEASCLESEFKNDVSSECLLHWAKR